MVDFSALSVILCQHRTPRPKTDLIVIHTNEGPEGAQSAEGLANYLRTTKNGAGYNLIVDQDSAVVCAGLHDAVWGAGGVNSRAYHLCLIGFAAQTAEQWDDPASRSTIAIARDLLEQVAAALGVPIKRVTDTRPGAPKGVCGHGDVSRFHAESMGHTDPGPNFPWDRLLGGATQPTPVPEDDDMQAKTFVRDDNGDAQEYFWDGTFVLPVASKAEKQVYVDNGIVKLVDAQPIPHSMLEAAYNRSKKMGLI